MRAEAGGVMPITLLELDFTAKAQRRDDRKEGVEQGALRPLPLRDFVLEKSILTGQLV